MNPNEIIDALGGTFRVAELCEVRPPSVSDWRKYGIPRARMMFLRIAKPDVFKALEAKASSKTAA
ncbi:hypothetical protein AB4P97_08275 [Pseudomonas sp. A1230]|uniref:hypothetical protein n=1 Tax=Pseudomonas sp. A1230 TaxID=3235106 RepID=UPI0037846B87